ncbi:NAD(+) synthase [Heliorestis acidaminivorans]|uniref:NH(3)-dependent NAD(+) synthetase n=1 Tax=Heliorestis acidaminivorans TaxID=553427 RepID=A0A6I0ERD9_9FIRM|nr:NAD(+) synthase [Heliorestis acidaminivorans]KAB2951246.1 NAD(+) synthase [Heliorestis acidaminivorans]
MSSTSITTEFEKNLEQEVEKRCQFIRQQVEQAGRKGIVVGLSGGIDSAVTAALCQRALGKENVLALFIGAHSAKEHEEDAELIAQSQGLRMIKVNLDSVTDQLVKQIQNSMVEGNIISEPLSTLTIGNTKARERMIVLYAVANQLGYLVAGTCNRTEIYLGYETKGGDQLCDFNPMASLVKAQVRALAAYLSIPEKIITKAPSADLWQGQTDEDEMGFTYEEVDRYILTGEGTDEVIQKIEKLHLCSDHKRKLPPVI